MNFGMFCNISVTKSQGLYINMENLTLACFYQGLSICLSVRTTQNYTSDLIFMIHVFTQGGGVSTCDRLGPYQR